LRRAIRQRILQFCARIIVTREKTGAALTLGGGLQLFASVFILTGMTVLPTLGPCCVCCDIFRRRRTGKGGMTLRKRLAMQRGIYADEMPYADPHTAAPALWALRQRTGDDYEVSTAQISGTVAWRKGLEALAVALHRQEFGRSPTVNFGRMPVGFRRSSGNNKRLVDAGKRFRGGSWDVEEPYHVAGLPPAERLDGDPHDAKWCGHDWSCWQSLTPNSDYPSPGEQGLYRIRDVAKPGLLYVGEGLVSNRLFAHLRKIQVPGDPQGAVFKAAERLECSWVLNGGWLSHQRLELECDLLGAHLIVTGTVPPCQFIG
jgi:hypothetical protein